MSHIVSILLLDFELRFQTDFMNFYFWEGGSKGPAKLGGLGKLGRFFSHFSHPLEPIPLEEKNVQETKRFQIPEMSRISKKSLKPPRGFEKLRRNWTPRYSMLVRIHCTHRYINK